MWSLVARPLPLVALLAVLPAVAAPAVAQECSADDPLAAARRHYENRAEGAVGALADPGTIGRSVVCYREALEADPERFDVRVELLRALFFQGEYATRSEDARKRIFEEGRTLFEESLDRLSRRLGVDVRGAEPEALDRALEPLPEARPSFFYGAILWGLWAESYGTMASLRKGVAGRLRDLGEVIRTVSPNIDHGGAHRFVGSLHSRTPRVVFLTMWADRDLAIEELEKAVAEAPDDPLNVAFLAEALAEHGPRSQRSRARELLQRVLTMEPRVEKLVEDRAAIEEAREIWREQGFG